MALYLDTSCLLKVFFPEPETAATVALVARESHVVISSLARLESLVHIHGRVAAKLLSAPAARRLIQRFDQVMQAEPYELVPCPPGIIEIAETQVRPAVKSTYCRTLDRLHLATMQALGVHRLLTNDETQARAARGLGFEITLPR
jgi:predicted nucleic acid-binding protein